MINKDLIKKYKLDEEEIDLLKEEGEYNKNNDKFFEKAVKNLKKKKTTTFSIDIETLNKIKKKASNYGMKYQSYINLFLNQLANDKLEIKIK